MQPIRSFVVRIYRDGWLTFAGVIEDVTTGRARPFHNVLDLWAALRMKRRRRVARKAPPEGDDAVS
jgi:hypothetical protein